MEECGGKDSDVYALLGGPGVKGSHDDGCPRIVYDLGVVHTCSSCRHQRPKSFCQREISNESHYYCSTSIIGTQSPGMRFVY